MFSRISIFGLFCIIVQLSHPTDSARILGFFTTPTRSHLIIHESLMRVLAVRGHDVTVVATLKQIGTPIQNYRYIQVPVEEDTEIEKLREKLLKDTEKGGENMFVRIPRLMNATTGRTSSVLKSSTMEKLKSEKFDLIVFGIFMNDFQIGLASVFNCPAVIISTIPNTKYVRDYVGNPTEVSAVPHLFLGANNRMTFLQRVKNLLFTMIEFVVMNALDYFVMEPLYVEHFPPEKYPSYAEAKRNVSIVLVNQHFSQDIPIALVPGLIEFSGMHIKRQADPLPEDIREWLDNATDGAILFSMGSNVQSSQITLEKRDAILRTFAKLKERILWKFEEDLPNKPSNVMISKWLPQDDVLAHANIKLFISHCGKGGISEAKYHGVPVLGIPIFGDQQSNIGTAVDEGWAVKLEYSELNYETFSKALNEILHNNKYAQVIKQLSLMFRDRPQHPLDTAAFWVEYVIRHKGAKHLQSPGVHLNFFQYYSIDVIAVLLVAIYLSFKIAKFVLKTLFRKCFGTSTKKKLNKR